MLGEATTAKVKAIGFSDVTATQWEALDPTLPPEMKPHLPFILSEQFKRLMKIEQRIRVKRLKIFDGIYFPLFPSMIRGKKMIFEAAIGGLAIGDEDPAVAMLDGDFMLLFGRESS